MQAALEAAVSLGGAGEQEVEVVDVRAELERLVMLRHDLGRVQQAARELTPDQQLVLASQVGLQQSSAEFCRLTGWTPGKYRKVAQRARARLRRLAAVDEPDVPSAVGCRKGEQGPTYGHSSPHP